MFSHTLKSASTLVCCNTTPIFCFACSGWRVTSNPATSICPWVGLVKVVSIRIVVDLPAPLGPSKPNISPGWIVNDKSLTTGVLL